MIYALLLLEAGAAGYWYLTSPYGYPAYHDAVVAYHDVQSAISAVNADIEELNATYAAWERDPFWYEQYARTQLHMGYPDERVYMLYT